jgi:hypothetical protein
VTKKPDQEPQKDRDERVSIPLDPEEALRELMQVDPESEPSENPPAPKNRSGARSS